MHQARFNPFLLLFAAALTAWTSSAWACQARAIGELAYFNDYENQLSGPYNSKGTDESGSVLIQRCEKSSGKYLMIALGAEQSKLSSELRDVSFDGRLSDDHCILRNPPPGFAIQPFEEKSTYYSRRTQFLRSCARVRVRETQSRTLVLAPNQSGCNAVQVDPRTIEFSGPYCFFRALPDTAIVAQPFLAPECAQRDHLTALGIDAMDVPAALNIYLSGDATGMSQDLTQLLSAPVRFSVSPGREMMPVSRDAGFNAPSWPAEWHGDVHFGPVAIQQAGEGRLQFDVSFVVDNRADGRCVNGLCSSPTWYSLPVAAELSLFRVSAPDARGQSRHDLLGSWYHGGVAAPRWAGVLKGNPLFLEEVRLAKSDRLELQARFGSPKEDFTLLKTSFRDFLIDLAKLAGVPGQDNVPTIPTIGDPVELPSVPKLTGPGTGGGPMVLQQTLEALRKDLGYALWPPYYERVCDLSGAHCSSAANHENTLLIANFKVGDQVGGNYGLDGLVIERRSLILPYYRIQPTRLPEVDCSAPGALRPPRR